MGTNHTLNIIFKTLVFFAILLFTGILLLIFKYTIYCFNEESLIKILVPFGVLLSAGLASASVMKSINNTNRIEEEKEEKKKKLTLKKFEYYFNQINFNIVAIRRVFKTKEENIKIETADIDLIFKKLNDNLSLVKEDKEIFEIIDVVKLIKILTNVELLLTSLNILIYSKIEGNEEIYSDFKEKTLAKCDVIESQSKNILKEYKLSTIIFEN